MGLAILGGVIGFFFGLKVVFVICLCIIGFLIWDSEQSQRRYEKACIEDKKYWEERAKRRFLGIKF